MKKDILSNKGIGTIFLILAILSGFISLSIAIFAQMKPIDIPVNEDSGVLKIVLYVLLIASIIMIVIEKYTSFTFNRNALMYIIIPLTATLGSLYSFLYIYSSMGNNVISGLYINNQINFLSLFFFVIYTLMYNGFLTDWWQNLKGGVFKGIMLFLLEIPNFISWWVLAFAAPLNYIEGIDTPEHFWLTFTFALSVVLFLTSIRLIKIKS